MELPEEPESLLLELCDPAASSTLRPDLEPSLEYLSQPVSAAAPKIKIAID